MTSFPACGGTVRLDIDGEETITSPGYPEPYGNYMQCDWLVRIVPGRRIGISFRTFELETNQVSKTGGIRFPRVLFPKVHHSDGPSFQSGPNKYIIVWFLVAYLY